MALGPAAHILVVTRRDPQDPLRRLLSEAGYRATSADSIPSAVRAMERSRPALVVVDPRVFAPAASEPIGKCAAHNQIPVLSDWSDPGSLISQIRRVLDNLGSSKQEARELVAGPLHVDFATHVATIAGGELDLTGREFDLLCHLARHPGWVWSRQELLEQVWGYDYGDPRVVTVHIANLRKKLNAAHPDSELIQTVRGIGYRLSVAEMEGTVAAEPESEPAVSQVGDQAVRDIRTEDERRLVTVLFMHVTGLDRFEETDDFESLRFFLDSLFEQVVPCIERYGGRADRFIARSVMAVFGAPIAHDNDSEMAVRAALAVRSAIQGFKDEHSLEDLSCHIGISTGKVVAGFAGDRSRTGYAVVGETIDVGALLADMAGPGEVLIAEETLRLTGHRFDNRLLGTVKPRGKQAEVPYYAVDGVAVDKECVGSARGITSALVGREDDLAVFRRVLAELAEGIGSVVFVTGEPGTGKSRLVAEVCSEAAARGLRWLEGRAASYGQTMSYLPIIEVVESDCEIEPQDPAEVRRHKVHRRLEYLFADRAAELIPVLSALVGVSSDQGGVLRIDGADGDEGTCRSVEDAISRYVARIGTERPVLLVLEDAHWLDRSSFTLAEKLLSVTKSAPVTICVTGRGETGSSTIELLRAARQDQDLRLRELRVSPLSDKQTAELVRNLLRNSDTQPEFVQMVQQTSEGNPFVVEEILRHLIDTRVLMLDGAGRWQLGAAVVAMPKPGTVHEVIAARIDRLPRAVRQDLLRASVVGHSFQLRLLQAVSSEDDARLLEHLACLEDRGLLYVRAREPEVEYSFKHSLVQEVAYGTMLTKQRRSLHLRVAQAIEKLFPAQIDSLAAVLGYHYSKAERWERAEPHLVKAGDSSAGLAAAPEAIAHYQAAIAALIRAFDEGWDGERSTGRAEWLVQRTEVLWLAQCLADLLAPAQALYDRVLTACGAADPRSQAATILLAYCYRHTYQYEQAASILEKSLAAAGPEPSEKNRLVSRLMMLLALCRLNADRLMEAEALLTQALRLENAKEEPDEDLIDELVSGLLATALLTGDTAQMRRFSEEAKARCRREEGRCMGMLLVDAGEADLLLGRWEKAASEAAQCLQDARDPSSRADAACLLGRVRHAQGAHLEGEEHLRNAASQYERQGRMGPAGDALAHLAEVQLMGGKAAQADQAVRRAISLLEGRLSDDSSKLAGPYWTLAGVEMARGSLEEAGHLLDKSMSILEQKCAPTHPLHAELRLRRALLYESQGHSAEAQTEFEAATGLLAGIGGEDHPRIAQMMTEWHQVRASKG